MYDRSKERAVFVASLPYMSTAKALGISKGMNDHGPLHAQRVHAIVVYLSALIQLSTHERDLVCAAALLHDIGMSKDRETHHIESARLVKMLTDEQKLPFTSEEGEVVSKLCEWHRKNYDADAIHSALGIRTGLLASILRLADAMDLDYRRAENYLNQETVISHVHSTQTPHHLSLLNIQGLRLYTSQMGTEIQLLVEKLPDAALQIERLVDELLGTPITWPVKLVPIREQFSTGLKFSSGRQAAIISYCNAHGIVQAGISKSALEMAGFTTNVICDLQTSHPPHFWSKIAPCHDFSEYRLIAILGLNLPDTDQDFLDLVRKYPKCHWIYATPLEQSFERVSMLLAEGVDLVIGDARVLFAGDALAMHAGQWLKIAGLCNADDWLTSSGGFNHDEYFAARGLRAELLKLYESKAAPDAFNALVDRVAEGDISSFIMNEKGWQETLIERMPEVDCCGRVVVLRDCNSIRGRFVYDLAYFAIEQQGVRPWDQNEFVTPYAICRFPFTDGRERILYLSRFSRLDGAVPIKYFVPYSDHQLGSGATIWHTHPSRQSADEAVDATVLAINNYFS